MTNAFHSPIFAPGKFFVGQPASFPALALVNGLLLGKGSTATALNPGREGRALYFVASGWDGAAAQQVNHALRLLPTTSTNYTFEMINNLANVSWSIDETGKVFQRANIAFVPNNSHITNLAGLDGSANATSLTISGAVTGGAPLQRDVIIATGDAANPQIGITRMTFGSNAAVPNLTFGTTHILSAVGAFNWDLSSSSGTFGTPTGIATFNGTSNTFTNGLITPSVTGTAVASSLQLVGNVTGGAPAQRDVVIATGNAANPQVLSNRIIVTSNAATGDVDILAAELDMNANVGGSGTIKRVATLSGAANASSILIQGENNVAPAQRDVVIQTGNAANPMVTTTRLTFTSNAATGQIDMTNADFDLNSNKIIVDGAAEVMQWKAGGTGVNVLDFTDVLRPTRIDMSDTQFIDDFYGAAVDAHVWRATGTTAQLADPLGGWVQVGNAAAGTSKIDFNDVYATAKANNPAMEWRGKLGTTPNRTDVIGLIGNIGASTADASLEGAEFRHTEAGAGATNWFAVTKAAGISTSTDTTVTADTNIHTFRIETTDGGTNWKFYIDGTLRATNNANTPTTSLQPAVEVTVTSGTPFINTDFVKLWMNRS